MQQSSSQPAPQATGPLAGVRVLDLTAVVLGPLATQILADYGADVIKVEAPEGDMMRANGVSKNPGMSSIFLAINRNKRSICIDLKQPEGIALVRELVKTCDVVVHNMRVQAIERLGLGYEAIKAIKPDIVYCAATGFEESGPQRGRPAFDDIIQAGSGLVGLNLMNEPDKAPQFVPSLIADKTAGMALCNAVLAALFHRERHGQGQYVEVPMLETMAAFVLVEHMGGLTFDAAAEPPGYTRLIGGGRQPYRTQDGYICMLPYSLPHWQAFLRETGLASILDELAISNRQELNANIRTLYQAVRELTPTRTSAYWLDLAERLDIPAMAISRLEDLPEHPQLKAVGLFQTAEHPTQGTIRYVRPTTLFQATPANVRHQAPHIGQHTLDILSEAGIDAERVEALLRAGVLGSQPQENNKEKTT